nr:MAG TPA: hypothetical protein [Caudoviricetes sp.]
MLWLCATNSAKSSRYKTKPEPVSNPYQFGLLSLRPCLNQPIMPGGTIVIQMHHLQRPRQYDLARCAG